MPRKWETFGAKKLRNLKPVLPLTKYGKNSYPMYIPDGLNVFKYSTHRQISNPADRKCSPN
jgi:hypothetical protein